MYRKLLTTFLLCLTIPLAIAFPFAGLESQDTNCNKRQQLVRREWSSLGKIERKDYIDAALCMQKKPARLSRKDVPAAHTRLDDFVATHINNTLNIHLSGIFFQWHRQFLYLWEKAMRDECGYSGAQPYWDWPRYVHDLAGSPLFDGSATSLSGDGVYKPKQGPYIVGVNQTLPHGTGGGCAISGPFKDQIINFGPYQFSQVFTGKLPPNWQAHTPHCLSRDLNNFVATLYTNRTAVEHLLAQPDIIRFQNAMTSVGLGVQGLGPHGGGHFSLGLSLQDFFASPADPAFWFHHGQIDRIWSMWQAKQPKTRYRALNGTASIFYSDLTPEVTLETVLDFGVLSEQRTVGDLMRIDGGEFCYRYEQ